MKRLFAEAFAEPLEEPVRASPEHAYDDASALSLLPDGRVFVEHVSAGETQTVTKAVGERDDRDEEETTITEADGETDTWWAAMDGTQTAVKAEADDWASTRTGMETQTFVDGEDDDWASAYEFGTETRVRGEADDWPT